MNDAPKRWYHELNRYHWFVLIVAALGWLFDTMDQQLFNLARAPAMNELLAPAPGVAPDPKDVGFYGGIATSIFLIGWATGGPQEYTPDARCATRTRTSTSRPKSGTPTWMTSSRRSTNSGFPPPSKRADGNHSEHLQRHRRCQIVVGRTMNAVFREGS